MNKNITLSEKNVSSFRRMIGWLSLTLSSLTLIAIAAGFIPIFQQSSNAWKMLLGIFEIFNIRTKPLIFCLLRFAFSLVYFLVLVLGIRNLIQTIKNMNVWRKGENDTNLSRSAISHCVASQNEIFVMFIVLMVLAHVLNAYKLGLWSTIILSVLILLNFAINYMKILLYKRDLIESIFSPLSTTLMLVITLLFVFNVHSVDFDMLIKQIFAFIRSILYVPFRRLFVSVFDFILIPGFTMYVIVRIVLLCRESVCDGIRSFDFTYKCKKFMITTLVGFVVIVCAHTISSDALNLWMLWNLITNHLEFALAGVAVFFLSKNLGTSLPNVPSYDDLIKEALESEEKTDEIIDETIVETPCEISNE